MVREEELVQKAKEVREALIEMAADEVDATHIEVGQIKAKDDTRKLLTVRVGGANRYVPYQGHDTSEFTVGDYWAIVFDDYGTIRLGWWVTNNAGGGTIPFRPHNLLDGDAHPDTVAQGVTRGSIIIGNSTPKWDELVVGVAGRVLTSDGTDVAWVAPAGGNGAEAIFGSCYGNHIAWLQAAAAQNTWYNISDADIADGELDGVTHDGDGKLTVPDSGEYLVLYTCCYLDNIANNHVEVGIEIDGSGAAEAAGRTHSENKFANQEEHLGGCVILDLTAGETVELAIRTIDVGAPNITIDGMNLAVYFLAGGADGATAIKWAVLL